MVAIGSNIASLKAQRRLAEATDRVGGASERLASGLRINKASDDAAGLAIATSLNANSRIFSQAIRNVNDGISALNIADSALDELTKVIMRSQELAEQSANGVYTATQRKALDEEAGALNKEANRVIATTEFNGRKIFAADSPILAIQAGAGDSNIYCVDITSGLERQVGDGSFTSTLVEAGGDFASGDVADLDADGNMDIVLGGNRLSVLLGKGDGTFEAPAEIIGLGCADVAIGDLNGDGVPDMVGVAGPNLYSYLGKGDGTFDTANGKTTTIVTTDALASVTLGDFNGDGKMDAAGVRGTEKLAQVFWGDGSGELSAGATYSTSNNVWFVETSDLNGDGKDDIVASGSVTSTVLLGASDKNMRAMPVVSGSGALSLGDINRDGNVDLITNQEITYGKGDGTFSGSTAVYPGMYPGGNVAADLNGDGWIDLVAMQNGDSGAGYVGVHLNNTDGSMSQLLTSSGIAKGGAIKVADMNNDGANDIVAFPFYSESLSTVGILLANTDDSTTFERPNLLTAQSGRNALDRLSRDLARINKARSNIGAYRSRLLVGAQNLESSRENYLAAASRISDADIAQESATLISQQILQQSAASVLAQANQESAFALKLLS